MLLSLNIQNYAIIDSLSIAPDAHLNIVTGETGAGKSIILGALSLILGQRVDTSILIHKDKKCIIEASFDISNNYSFQTAIKSEDIDADNPCIIRREVATNGKSRAFINDTPVNLNTLTKLTSLLIDLHQQFDNHHLENSSFQMSVIDALSHNQDLRSKYSNTYNTYIQLCSKIEIQKSTHQKWQAEADYKQFLFDELENAAFIPNEIEILEVQLKQLNASDKILNVLQHTNYSLESSEHAVISELKKILQQLSSIESSYKEILPLKDRIESAYLELKDINNDVSNLESNIQFSPDEINKLEERLSIGLRLLKKHNLKSTQELIDFNQQLKLELEQSVNLSNNINDLEQEKEKLFEELNEIGFNLNESRVSTANNITPRLVSMLNEVGMPNAQFHIEILNQQTPQSNGFDQIEFLLDLNHSGKFLPISKVASGGELSRIALCIKTLIAKEIQLPTLIFDEVDTGISGEASLKVAAMLVDLSKYHQVFCITHQVQVAAKGDRHFYVYKEPTEDKSIKTRIKILTPDEKILMIAKMIGGDKPSDIVLKNAQELIESVN